MYGRRYDGRPAATFAAPDACKVSSARDLIHKGATASGVGDCAARRDGDLTRPGTSRRKDRSTDN